jgi:hypothetical protein
MNFGGGEIIRGQPSAVPGPTAGEGLLVYRLRAVALSARGDGVRKSPEQARGAPLTQASPLARFGLVQLPA